MTDERPLAELTRLDGKVAVITGGGQGIGLQIARRFSEAGAHVVLADMNESVHEAAAALVAEGRSASSAVLNVTDEVANSALAAKVAAEQGSLDIWVNNAGIYPTTPVMDIPTAEWQSVFDVNVNGTFFGARAAAKHMIEQGSGVILNISSTSGFRVSNDGVSHYVASKHAVGGLTKALARELGPHGIRVLALAPMLTVTPTVMANVSNTAAAQGEGFTEDAFFARYTDRVPLRRVATPDDMSLVAVFCVSGLAGYVTGSTIAVDGGLLAV
ncbi:SDR family oxidoreductase [soil metagenome]